MHSRNRQPATVQPWRDVGGLRVRLIRYSAGTAQPRHCHPEAGVSLVIAGSVEETAATTVHRAQVGALVVKPASCWHANLFGPRGAQLIQVSPHDDCEFAWGDFGYRWLDAPRLSNAMLRLWTQPAGAAESAELIFWETIATLQPSISVADHSPHYRWWREALEILNAEAVQSVSVAAIARRVGVHPVHLARVCRRELGCSVQDYLRQRRTRAAWQACAEDSQPLTAVAARCGFADQSHMTRAFTRELGISPARLRRLVHATA
jgi:AraC family transcriptional regulator